MKKKFFFIILLIVISAVWVIFFDTSPFIWYGSFLRPVLIWLTILLLYLNGGRSPLRNYGDSEMDEFDRCLQKRKDVSQHESANLRDVSDRESIKSGTAMLEQDFEINKNKRVIPQKKETK